MLLSIDVIIFGATGMVGQGVLRECLRAPEVRRVLTIGRTPIAVQDAKLQEIVYPDIFNYADIEPQLTGFDAYFFSLGVASSGMNEADYRRITYELTLAAA
jgi:putative NADH-flavin reductase